MYILLTLLYYTYYGLFAIVVAPSLQVSSVACTIFYALWNLFSGVLITLPEMPVSHWKIPPANSDSTKRNQDGQK